MEEKKMMKQHKISMESREILNISGVEDVDSFDENEIRIYTTEGLLTVRGNDLHMSHLNVEDGDLIVEGEIDGINYSNVEMNNGGFFSKLFK